MKDSIGWILLIIGVILIFWGIYYSYQIFTLKVEPPQIFKSSEENVFNGGGEEPQDQLRIAIEEQLNNLLPVNAVPKLLNLVVWSMFSVILFMGAAHVSAIGVRLIK
jgi:hypothetical protein